MTYSQNNNYIYSLEHARSGESNGNKPANNELTKDEVIARERWYDAMNKTLYSSGQADNSDLKSRLNSEGFNINTEADNNLKDVSRKASDVGVLAEDGLQEFGIDPDDIDRGSLATVTALELEDKEGGDVIANGVLAEVGRGIGLEIEGDDPEAISEILNHFSDPETAKRVMQAVYDIGKKHGSVNQAPVDRLVQLGRTVESASVIGSGSGGELVVTTEDDGSVDVKTEGQVAEQRQEEAEEALEAARAIAA